MTRTRIRLHIVRSLLLALLYAGSAAPALADIVYGVTGQSGNPSSLYMLNTSSGVATLVSAVTYNNGALTVPISLAGLAYVPNLTGGPLIGVTNSMSTNNPNSVFAISNTGAATLLGTLSTTMGTTVTSQSLAYSSANSTLYGYSITGVPGQGPTQSVVTISTSNSAAGPFGTTGTMLSSSSGNGLAVAPTGSSLGAGTMLLGPTPVNSQGNSVTLDTINTTPGPTLGEIASTQAYTGPNGSLLANSNIKALAFDSSGNLWGLDFVSGTSWITSFNTSNNTISSATNITLSTNPSTNVVLIGLAFEPASVPEPGSFVLVGLAAAGVGLFYRSRRRPVELAV